MDERLDEDLIDKKKVIITESSIKSDLHLEDAGGVELMNKRKETLAMLRAERKEEMSSTNKLKRGKMFDNEMRRVNTFIPMDSEVVKSKKETEESSKGTEDELESDKSKKAEVVRRKVIRLQRNEAAW
ncbi:hypothetical protein Tco_0315817 [Tanacetum coccineum]